MGQNSRAKFSSHMNFCSTKGLTDFILSAFLLLTTRCLLTESGPFNSGRNNCQCPMNVSISMGEKDQLDGLFRGLFNTESDIANLTNDGYEIDEIEHWNNIRRLTNPQRCTGRHCGISIGRSAESMSRSTCCDATEFIIQPLTVLKHGRKYDVVHLPDAPQLISTSTCSESLAPCGSQGVCSEMMGYTWILIYDVQLTYTPPVKFVPIQFPSGCVCVY